MQPEDLRQLLLDYSRLIKDGAGTPQEQERLLPIYVDKIALAGYELAVPWDFENYLRAEGNYDSLRGHVSSLFPDFSYYNIPIGVSIDVGAAELGTGDPIDDILEITGEIRGVLKCWEEKGTEPALKAFSAAYAIHLGRHLRELQLYLFARANEAPRAWGRAE